jgi:hypothetical protein
VLNNGQASLASSSINMTATYLYNHSMPGHLLARGASPDAQYWEFSVTGDGDDQWEPGEVLEVLVVSPAYSFAPGDYELKMLLYNGAVVQYSYAI